MRAAKKILAIGICFLIGLSIAQSSMAQRTYSDSLKFLALGDSYTIGESVAENERWPVQLVEELRKRNKPWADPSIIATTGWRTDELKTAIAKAELSPDFDLVSLLIGVNNFYQGKTVESYATEFEELLQTAVNLAKGRKENVIVISIPDYGFTPFGKNEQQRISAGIDEFNNVNQKIATEYDVRYFDITPISRKGLSKPELVAEDGLHPSGKMYAEWIRLILPVLVRD